MPITHASAGLPFSTMESDTPTPSMDNVANLAAAIALLAQNLASPATPAIPQVKIRELDPFDGMDPHQLHTFLLQCSLNLKNMLTLLPLMRQRSLMPCHSYRAPQWTALSHTSTMLITLPLGCPATTSSVKNWSPTLAHSTQRERLRLN